MIMQFDFILSNYKENLPKISKITIYRGDFSYNNEDNISPLYKSIHYLSIHSFIHKLYVESILEYMYVIHRILYVFVKGLIIG